MGVRPAVRANYKRRPKSDAPVPYRLKGFRRSYRLRDILEIEAKKNNGLQAWIFVLIRADTALDDPPAVEA